MSFCFSVFYFVIYSIENSIFISVLVLVILERQQTYFISVSYHGNWQLFYFILSCIYFWFYLHCSFQKNSSEYWGNNS